jgi:hypothetical protein
MKKVLILSAAMLFAMLITRAQEKSDTAWKIKSDVSLMFSQASFTNWAAGGENNINLTGYLNFYAGYINGKSKWENLLALAYGQTKTGTRAFRKSEDKIDFLSTYGLKANDKWFYSANLSLKSQLAEGFDYHADTAKKTKISNFLAPAYIALGVGIENKPYDFMSFYLSPVTARWIIVNDQDLADAGAFGVKALHVNESGDTVAGEKTKFETGAYFRFLFMKDIIKNVNLSTKLELFSNYLDNPQNVDINWDTMIKMQVNSWLAANVGMLMIYDDDTPVKDKDGNTGPRTQIKEILSVGITYKISNR